MKKVKIVLSIISIIIIVLGIIVGIGTSNEILNSISVDNSVNGVASGIEANSSGILEVFGVFGAKLIGTMILVCSIIIDILIWLFYGLILLSIKITKKIKNIFLKKGVFKMIKVGKLQVNNGVSAKQYLVLSLLLSLISFILLGYTIFNYIQTKDYIKLNAIITEVGYYEVNDSTVNYIKVNYNYDNHYYTNKQRVAFRFNKKEGNEINIYINPNNPNQIKNSYNSKVFFVLSIFSCLITIFLVKSYLIRKKQ